MDKEYISNLKKFSQNLNVLYVEDNKQTRDSTLELLQIFFNDIIVSTNGQEGLDDFLASQIQDIHLVITDINMPKLNGLDMVSKIKEHDADIFILIISAYDEVEYFLKSIKIQVNSYLLKPIKTNDFIHAISKIVEQIKQKHIINHDAINSNIIFLNEEIFLNSDTNILTYQDKSISLRKREKDFLLLLYNNKTNITTYKQIELYLWEDKVMTNSALKTFIKEIRQKIPIKLIQNIPREGYKLLA